MTEAEGKWLEQLFTSPEVYMSCSIKEQCISDVTLTSILVDPITNVLQFTQNIPDKFVPSDKYVVEFCGGDFTAPDYIASVAAGDPNVTLTGPITDVPASYVGLSIKVIYADFGCKFNPVIIRNADWQEKIKLNTRNINYNIAIDLAHNVNIQRN
jgi:hypothetical protein